MPYMKPWSTLNVTWSHANMSYPEQAIRRIRSQTSNNLKDSSVEPTPSNWIRRIKPIEYGVSGARKFLFSFAWLSSLLLYTKSPGLKVEQRTLAL
ncbi:hypothetical protein Tco_1430993 [Tanacetum coccineum]